MSSSKLIIFNLNIALFQFFTAGFILFNRCLFNHFYITVTLPCENVNIVSLIFSKIVKTNIDSALLEFIPSTFFNCPTNSICSFAFGSESNSFCLLRSNAINLS